MVVEEEIRPQLTALQRQLKAPRRNLALKGGGEVVLGSMLVTVGALSAMPPLIGLGLTTTAASLRHLESFLDATTELEMSDLYILIEATTRSQ